MGATNTHDRLAYAEVIRHPGFVHLWFGQICSQFAFSTLLFALGLRIYQSTGSNAAVSALFLFHSIPAVLFGLVAGTLVDRIDKRRVLVASDIIRGSVVFLLAFFSHNVFAVYMLTFINSLVTQLYIPSAAPLIPTLLPARLLVSANSLFSFTFFSSLAVGSVLAGPMFRGLGHQGIFFLIAGVFWLGSWFSRRIPSQSQGTVGFRYIMQLGFPYLAARVWFRLIDGIRYVGRSKSLLEALLLLTGTQTIFAILGTLAPGFAHRVLGVDVRDATVLVVGPAVLGIVLGALWLGSVGFRFGAKKLVHIGVAGVGITLIAIALSGGFVPLAIFLLFLLGVANSFMDVPANALLQQQAAGDMRGRVYGMLAVFVGGVGLLPVFMGGVFADTIGIEKTIVIMGSIVCLYSVYRIRYNR